MVADLCDLRAKGRGGGHSVQGPRNAGGHCHPYRPSGLLHRWGDFLPVLVPRLLRPHQARLGGQSAYRFMSAAHFETQEL